MSARAKTGRAAARPGPGTATLNAVTLRGVTLRGVTLRGVTLPGVTLRGADILLPVSVALWAIGVSQTDPAALGPYGLPAALPILFYAGLGLLVVSAGIELGREQPSGRRLGLHAAALVVMLYGTAPLVYSQGRYAWLYKTIGVVQYIAAHGQLDRHIDIYQNWPGFFALAAWLGKVAGVASPLAYAKWAQLAVELAALPLLRLIYTGLGLTVRQRWVALLLYPAANWIGQDYFSPQALGTLLSLAIFAVALRWLGGDRSARQPTAAAAPFCALIAGLYWVLTSTHELSPYIVVVQLGALAVVRQLRPRWLPVALAAISVGYLVPRLGYVSAHYGLLDSIGSFFSNVAPPSFQAGVVPESEIWIRRSAELLSLAIWILAAVGAWRRRRAGQPFLGLLLLTYSPVIVLAGQAYGDEGILRVYLFSLPWAAALAAAALAPAGQRILRIRWDALLAPAALLVALVLFFPAFFGDDSSNVMTAAEVGTVTAFLRTARPGPVYSAIANAPLADTSRYNLFPLPTVFGSGGVAWASPGAPDIVRRIQRDSLQYTSGRKPVYVLITPSMITYSRALGIAPPANIARLAALLRHSPGWRLVASRGGTIIYELPPGYRGSR